MGILSFIRSFQFNESAHPPSPHVRAPIEALHDEPRSNDELFRIHKNESPWGDYGSILLHGMTSGRNDGQLRLSRVGSFVPPISFPGVGNVIVTDELRELMIAAGFRGVTFRPVEKVHIVQVNYHRWNWVADEPRYYPRDSEPECYLDGNHSERASRQIGELWEVVLTAGVEMHRSPKLEPSGYYEFRAYRETRNDADLFSCDLNLIRYCSLRAKLWFEKHVPGWARFEPIAFAAEDRPPQPPSLPEEAAFVLFAARNGVIEPLDIRRWACSKTYLPSAPPPWIVNLLSAPLSSNDDAFETLEKYAVPLSHRRKLQVMLYACAKRRISFAELLLKLQVAVADQTPISPEDIPLANALAEWKAGESYQALPETRMSALQKICQTYLEDTPDLEILFLR